MKKLFLFSGIFSSFLLANNSNDLESLSLEDLLKIEVTSTSRREEPQHLASGVITVVSAQEIKQFGARHLRDVIDRLVGMQVLSSHQRPHNKTSIRAMNGAHQEGWEVVLLNGRPIHDATDGGFNFDLYLGFPLNTIDRIEIIRGPGSVIYGSNAMAGVINIITKDPKKSINETRIDLSGGSFNRRQLQLSTLKGGADYSLNIGLNSIRSEGDTINGVIDKDNLPGAYESGEKSDNLVINATYKNFTLNTMVMKNILDSGGSTFQLPSQPMKKNRYFIDAGYQYTIASGWDASLNYTVNIADFDWQISEAGGRNHYKDRSNMTEAIVRGNVASDLNLLFGANFMDYTTAFTIGFPSSRMRSKSAYTQFDYMLTPKQKIIGGIQWNKPEETCSDLSSRIGFIQGLSDQWWVKLLYSEAYRSANLQEAKIDAPTLKGNPFLDPEKVATYDAQLIYQTPTRYFAVSLYDTTLRNLIVRVPGTPTTFTNQGHVRFQGLEVEGKMEAKENLSIIGNFSYQHNKNDKGVEDTTFAPNVMAKIGISHQGFRGMGIGLFNSYFGKSTDLTVTNGVPLKNPKPEGYNLLTANVSVDTAKMWGVGKPGNSMITLYLDNLLDKEIYTPNLNYTNGTNTVPHHWGRSANITYSYKF
ncbi:MAG: TonB-dependent receptor [Sulfuricurvum sp.]|jgi:outer membrane receptor for ferrienterochelin and colicin|uniref:TonB-dependent receptor plug domain-containing protein n=1 Tax=Sulfuricurvum sp. TaxID=2025608 RepID=UPI0025E3E928|nr:TonB-dependent receptor [Sulfuricurvum sp.]MCK9371975.1 TonB-dependent receptor [Sulfuricurvum sp.]